MTPKSLHELALIVEMNYGQTSPSKAGGQVDSVNGKHSYKKGHMLAPGIGGRVNEIPQTVTPIECEETDPVIAKIVELEKEADKHGQQNTLQALLTLKEFIKDLNGGEDEQ